MESGNPILSRILRHLLDRLRADPSRWNVDDPCEGCGIVGVRDHSQVRQYVLNLLPLVEPHGSEDRVWNPIPHEHFLQHTALLIRPVHHSDLLESSWHHSALYQALCFFGDVDSFVGIIDGFMQKDLGAGTCGGGHVLSYPVLVLLDDSLSGGDDGVGAPVIVLQDDLSCIEIPTEAIHIGEVSTPPSVDALICVPDHKDRAALRRRGEKSDELVLRKVGVLPLVDEDVPPGRPDSLQHLTVGLEQANSLQQDVVEIQRAAPSKLLLIERVDLLDLEEELTIGASQRL
mmetsp:Transcript_47510/g.148644  ORF Transcript_47510/g.148644 Transcript_47510/m.148644 type:complete len:288 (+) Transcript_47510:931-1794(+)